MANENKDNKEGKAKRILAMAGIIILLGLYVVTLVAAIMAKPYANKFFIASVMCSLIIPVFIYGFMVVSKAFGRKEVEISLHELRKMKKQMKNMPDEEEQVTSDDSN